MIFRLVESFGTEEDAKTTNDNTTTKVKNETENRNSAFEKPQTEVGKNKEPDIVALKKGINAKFIET